jgi:lipid biosynthesis B12-binding/radical SAM protein
MSRFFLVSSNINTDPYPVYPLGMAVVASALMAAGHQVCQYDYLAGGCSESGLRKLIQKFAPDFVGISLRNIDNADSFSSDEEWYLDGVRSLIAVIRQENPAPIIVGGPGFSVMPQDILDYIGADFGVVGEAERALCRLIELLEQGQSAPRIVNENGAPLSATQMASPCWDEAFIRFYVERSGMINLQTKRGCPHNCLYCSYPQLEGNRLRPMEPAKVVEEIRRLKQVFGVSNIFFADSVFNDIAGHYLVFAEELLRQDLDITWYGFFRPQGINFKELRLLKRSGLAAMEVGTDAASDKALAGINKQFTFEDVIKFNQDCIQAEIPTAHFIIFGGPDETDATVAEGLKNISKLQKCVVFAFSGIRIYPNTALYDRALQEGILDEKDSLLKPIYYFSPDLAPETMNNAIETAFRGRRELIFPPSEGLIRLATMNRFGFRGLLWDQLISFKNKTV